MGKIKQINIKNRTYYFYNEMIAIEDFDPSLFLLYQKNLNYTNKEIQMNLLNV